MGDEYPTLRAAAVQAAPVFLDREGTVEKAYLLVCEAARRADAHVVMGLNERRPGMTPGTLNNTMLFIHRDSSIIGKHQKLMSTFTEKIVHAMGAGDNGDPGRTERLGEHVFPPMSGND